MVKRMTMLVAVLLTLVAGQTWTVWAAPGGAGSQQAPLLIYQAEFQQALADRLGTSLEVIQDVMEEARVQAQDGLIRPMNVAQVTIALLAERLDMALEEVAAVFNEVHLAVIGVTAGTPSQVLGPGGRRGNSGRNSPNANWVATGRGRGNNTCPARSVGMPGRSAGNRGNRQNLPMNNPAVGAPQQALFQSTVLRFVADNLGVDYEVFLVAFLDAHAAASTYAQTATVRPINMQAKLFEYLADALGKTVEEVVAAFEQARA